MGGFEPIKFHTGFESCVLVGVADLQRVVWAGLVARPAHLGGGVPPAEQPDAAAAAVGHPPGVFHVLCMLASVPSVRL